jgi:hypothetical protein
MISQNGRDACLGRKKSQPATSMEYPPHVGVAEDFRCVIISRPRPGLDTAIELLIADERSDAIMLAAIAGDGSK